MFYRLTNWFIKYDFFIGIGILMLFCWFLRVSIFKRYLGDIMKKKTELLLPFILMFSVILLDQITKLIVLKTGSEGEILFSMFGDFFRIVLVYNTGAAFSLGTNFSPVLHFISLKLLPLLLIVGFIVLYFRINFTKVERYLFCAILGGGFGNLIDRFFRSRGVVDFIDVKFYGIFGFERWPTFNIADSVVVVSLTTLILYHIFRKKDRASNEKNKS